MVYGAAATSQFQGLLTQANCYCKKVLFKGTGHVWYLPKTSNPTQCIPTYAEKQICENLENNKEKSTCLHKIVCFQMPEKGRQICVLMFKNNFFLIIF